MTGLGARCAEIVYHSSKSVINRLLPHKYSSIGEESIPQKDGFVLWAFHDNIKNIWEDANLTDRRLCFIAKSELFNIPAVGLALRVMHHIRFKRDSGGAKAFYSGLERAIRENAGIVLYPEGTRNETQTVGGTGRLMHTVAGYIIKMSGKYHCRIDFVAVGREAKIVDGKRTDVTVKCLPVAYAIDGELKVLDAGAQREFEQRTAENKNSGLEFLVNSVIMPNIASLSNRAYDPGHSTFKAVYG